MELTAEQEKFTALLQQAAATDEGLSAMAAAISTPIEQEIKLRSVYELLYAPDELEAGAYPIYPKAPVWGAWYVAMNGDPKPAPLDTDEVAIPILRVHDNPMADVSVLQSGRIGKISDLATKSGLHIANKWNKYAIALLSAAVPAANTVDVYGTSMTKQALADAQSILEDQELGVKYLVMRKSRFNDMSSWSNISPQLQYELETKGVTNMYGGSSILNTSFAEKNEILLVPDQEIGKMPIRSRLQTEAVKKDFQRGWLAWEEMGFGITMPQWTAKIRILGVVNAPTIDLSIPVVATKLVTVIPTAGADAGIKSLAIAWGDGHITTGCTSGLDYSHTYATAATFEITGIVADNTGEVAVDYATATTS